MTGNANIVLTAVSLFLILFSLVISAAPIEKQFTASRISFEDTVILNRHTTSE
jgi:hypothetical protein